MVLDRIRATAKSLITDPRSLYEDKYAPETKLTVAPEAAPAAPEAPELEVPEEEWPEMPSERNMTATKNFRQWVTPVTPTSTAKETREAFAGMGVSADIARLAELVRSSRDPSTGGIYGSMPETDDGVPASEAGPLTATPELTNRSGIMAMHEAVHSFERYMTDDMRQELDSITQESPAPQGTPTAHHSEAGALAPYFDYAFTPAFLSADDAAKYKLPEPVSEFINRHLPEVTAAAEQDNRSRIKASGLPEPGLESPESLSERLLLYGDLTDAETTAMAERAGLVPDATGQYRKPGNMREELQRRRAAFSTEQAGTGTDSLSDFMTSEIPGARAVRGAVHRVDERTGIGKHILGPAVQSLYDTLTAPASIGAELANLLGLGDFRDEIAVGSEVARSIGEELPESAVPMHPWEVGLELVPGIGTVPDLARAGRRVGTAGVRNIAMRSINDPQAGTPIFRYMVQNKLNINPDDLMTVLPRDVAEEAVGSKVYYHGTAGDLQGDLREGMFLTPNEDDARVFAEAQARLTGKEARVYPIRVTDDAVAPYDQSTLTGSRGTVTLQKPEHARIALPRIAGAAEGPDPNVLMREMINSSIERPEAQDFLRKVVAHNVEKIPGIRMLQHAFNRSAVAEEPYLKGAIGYRMLEEWHASQLDYRLKGLALKRDGLPIKTRKARIATSDPGEVVDDWDIQVLVPRKAPAPGKPGPQIIDYSNKPNVDVERPGIILAPERGPTSVAPYQPPAQQFDEVHLKGAVTSGPETKWVGLADVFEHPEDFDLPDSVMAYIDEAKSVIDEYATEFERVTGETIRTKDRYWPRLVSKSDLPETRGAFSGAGKPAPSQQRVIELMEDGLEAGVPYRNDGLQEIYAYGRGLQRGVRNSVLQKYLKDEGVLRALTPGERPTRVEIYGSNIGFGTDSAINRLAALEIQKVLGPMSGAEKGVTTVVGALSSIPRAVLAGTMDAGQMFLQTQLLMFWNPKPLGSGAKGAARFLSGTLTPPTPASVGRWAEANSKFFQVMFFGPDSYNRWVTKWAGGPVAQRYGVHLGVDTEFTEGLAPLRRVSKVATAPLGRTQEAFGAAVGTARMLSFDTLARVAAKTGANSPDEMYRLGRISNAMTGSISTRAIGQSDFQRQLESAAIMFAPRYTRSAFAVAGYAAGKGFGPQQVRLMLAQTALWGGATVYGINFARNLADGMDVGEAAEDALNSINPTAGKRFGSVKIGKGWYGIGGIYRATIEAVGGASRMSEWEDYFEQPLEVWKNPVLQHAFSYWRSRSAPATSTLSDFIEGEDFVGRGVSFNKFVDDPSSLLEYASGRVLPLTLQAYLQAQGSDWQERVKNIKERPFDPDALAQTAGGAGGLRTSPETAGEFLRRMQNEVVQERFGDRVNGYDELKWDAPARWEIRQDPRVQRALERLGSEAQEREITPEDKYYERLDAIESEYSAKQKLDDDAVLNGTMEPRRWRDEWTKRAIEKQAHTSEARLATGAEFDNEAAPPGTPNGAIEAYFAKGLDEYMDPETREPDWDSFFEDRERALSTLSAGDRRRVEGYINKNLTPVQLEYRQAQKLIDSTGYFKVRQSVASGLKLDLTALNDMAARQLNAAGAQATPSNIGKVVDKILEARLLESQALKYGMTPDGLKNAASAGRLTLLTMDNLKKTAREGSPQLDAQLYRWGYDSCVRSTAAQAILQNGVDSGLPAYFPAKLCEDVARKLQ